MKKGFDKGVCHDCAYNDRGTCTVNKRSIFHQAICPKGYTWEEIRSIYADIKRRMERSHNRQSIKV